MRQAGTALGAALGMGLLILDSHTALAGAAVGIELCLRTVVPALFPFLFLSNVFTGALSESGIGWLRWPAKWFRLPEGMEALLIPAFLGGYPVGAQSAALAAKKGILSKTSAERMLSYCSNAGPSFLFGILTLQFQSPITVWYLWGIQILSAWSFAVLFGTSPIPRQKLNLAKVSQSPLSLAIEAISKICGWVVLFRVLIAFLNRWVLWMLPLELQTAVVGILELSNGCTQIRNISDEGLRFIVASGLMAFGGLCVMLQTFSICHPLRMRYYIVGKIIQAVIALVLAWGVWYRKLYILLVWFSIALACTLWHQKKSGISG